MFVFERCKLSKALFRWWSYLFFPLDFQSCCVYLEVKLRTANLKSVNWPLSQAKIFNEFILLRQEITADKCYHKSKTFPGCAELVWPRELFVAPPCCLHCLSALVLVTLSWDGCLQFVSCLPKPHVWQSHCFWQVAEMWAWTKVLFRLKLLFLFFFFF